MNVRELREILDRYPAETCVIVNQCSDYAHVEAEGISIVPGVEQDWGVMRSHPTMSDENKGKEKSYLLLGPG